VESPKGGQPSNVWEIEMKTLIFALCLVFSASGSAIAGDGGFSSPAALRIAGAQMVLQKQPNRYQAYNDLALALVRRARETGDTSYYGQAGLAIASSLKIEPGNFEAQEAQVDLLLAEHKYRPALEEARALNHRMPDAVLVWGYIAEAEAALGDYQQADEAAQWMMDLRPGNVPAYLTGADLREDWGDIDGAEEYLSKALQQTPPFETEETAWILTRMTRLLRQSGRPDTAEALLQKALKTFPDYYLSLEELAEVRLDQHLYPEAVELLEKRNQNFPSPLSQLLAARGYEGAGRRADAAKMYAEFEREARAQITLPGNANIELIIYYADHAHQPQESLRIARLEMENRRDVRTLDAYAWALYANGQYAEAQQQIERALTTGARDAVLYYHAGAIEAAVGKEAEASHYLQQSLDLNPMSEVSETARRAAAQFPVRGTWE
jgi:tetratricopeptide (TPR) repeat protein